MRPYHFTLIAFALCITVLLAFDPATWMIMLCLFLLLNVLAAGAIFIRLNFFLPALHHAKKATTDIALSFDDGPADFTGQILAVLEKENVQAAFFCIGKNAAANPEMIRRWDAAGHLIGNHSFHHGFWFDMLPAKKMLNELLVTNNVIQKITGKRPLLFRPPYGVTNPALARAVRRSGMLAIGWSLRSFDTKAKNAEALMEKVCNQLKGGDVILLHDSMKVTAEALTSIIHTARQKGFTFVRLDKLLNIEPYA